MKSRQVRAPVVTPQNTQLFCLKWVGPGTGMGTSWPQTGAVARLPGRAAMVPALY